MRSYRPNQENSPEVRRKRPRVHAVICLGFRSKSFAVRELEGEMKVEMISALTFKVANMRASVRFYRDILGLELLYGGEEASFSSLRAPDGKDPILNLELGNPGTSWGRLIFLVPDVDQFRIYLKEHELRPADPRNGSWGERYFHMLDPDGHELSFARPLVPSTSV
jgi:catechol 2,3-dioxygenase-like lactoylglutathione lyase family enzyme